MSRVPDIVLLPVAPGVRLYRGLNEAQADGAHDPKLIPKQPIAGRVDISTILRPSVHYPHVLTLNDRFVSFSLQEQMAIYYATHTKADESKAGYVAIVEMPSDARGICFSNKSPAIWEAQGLAYLDPRHVAPSATDAARWIEIQRRSCWDQEILLVQGEVLVPRIAIKPVTVADWDGCTLPWVKQGWPPV